MRASWRDWLWVLSCAILSSVWCVSAGQHLNATYDEASYLQVGLQRWRTGSFRELSWAGTMPLPVDVATLPLYCSERVSGRVIDLQNETAHWLPVARAAALVFWWGLLIYAWRTAHLLAGPWAGRWAVALLAAEPTFLGHAGLAATDVASAASLLALAFHYRTARDRTGWRGWIAPVFWFGVALLAKVSAILYGPICMLAAEFDYQARNGLFVHPDTSWRQHVRPMLVRLFRFGLRVQTIVVLGFLLASLYCGSAGQVWNAIATQIRHNHHGHDGTFLLGRWSEAPVWYYFPVALTIKLSLPLLLLTALVVLVRPRSLMSWPLLAAAALLLASLTCRIQIGVRYLLPCLALAVVGLAAAGVQLWREQPLRWVRRGLVVLAAALVLATTVTAARTWPHGLSYTNGLWGHPEDGYLLLSDSNYDWGQGLYELAEWQRNAGAGTLDVAYFGTDPTLRSLDMHFVTLPELSLDRAGPAHKLAVSTTALFGHPHSQSATAQRLRALTPVARTTTFLIYDLPAGRSAAPS
jgi:hypothetical protein